MQLLLGPCTCFWALLCCALWVFLPLFLTCLSFCCQWRGLSAHCAPYLQGPRRICSARAAQERYTHTCTRTHAHTYTFIRTCARALHVWANYTRTHTHTHKLHTYTPFAVTPLRPLTWWWTRKWASWTLKWDRWGENTLGRGCWVPECVYLASKSRRPQFVS
jgi:hypothetical protein